MSPPRHFFGAAPVYVPRMQIEHFEAAHIEDASALLAARHRRDRTAASLLPSRFEAPADCAAAISKVLALEGSGGAVATEGGRMTGYLLYRTGDDIFGSHVWCGMESHAYDGSGGAEVLRHLYGALAGEWVGAGRGHHYVMTPERDLGALDRWFHLAFGHQQVHALMEVEPREPSPVEGFAVRQIGPGDEAAIEPLVRVIWEAHRQSPVFAVVDDGDWEGLYPSHVELLNDPKVGYFIAEGDDGPLGHAVMDPVIETDHPMFTPEGSIYLEVAATVPEERGRGVMTALVDACMNWSASEGYEVCVTDWRATNLLSSRYWLRRGFRPVAYRLHRVIDPRLVV